MTLEQKQKLKMPRNVTPYPLNSDQIFDKPVSNSGGNFGSLSCYGAMDEFVAMMHGTLIRDIPVREWLLFFKDHST